MAVGTARGRFLLPICDAQTGRGDGEMSREGKPLVEIAARECETFFKIYSCTARGTNIKINRSKPMKEGAGKRNRAEEPIRGNFDDEVLRNISRSQLPVARPQPRIERRKLRRSCSDPSCFKFPCFTFAEFSREVWWSRRQEWHFFYPGRVIFHLSFYLATRLLGRGYQFTLSRMNFYGLFFFINALSGDLLYPASLSVLACIFHFISLNALCSNKRRTWCIFYFDCVFFVILYLFRNVSSVVHLIE